MDKLLKDLKELVLEEYGRASEKFGAKHNSPHEAYAVILEEIEEANDAIEATGAHLGHFWYMTKSDNPELNVYHAANMRDCALKCAAEMIQVAAMAHKAIQGYGE